MVEHDPAAGESLVGSLRRQGYEAACVTTGVDALAEHHWADLVLLDLELPDLDGLEVCRGIRAVGDTPIIAVTARGSALDQVLGLQAGFDDYVVKPYGFRELLARCEAVMRRVRGTPLTFSSTITHGPLHIDRQRRDVLIHGRPVDLTRKEFDLLQILASQPETVFSRRELAARVWDGNCTETSRTIDTHVSSLRAKLGASTWIVTVRGVGFRFGHGGAAPCPRCGAPLVDQAQAS